MICDPWPRIVLLKTQFAEPKLYFVDKHTVSTEAASIHLRSAANRQIEHASQIVEFANDRFFKNSEIKIPKKIKVRYDMERRECLSLEAVTSVGT
jgi:hypothetical protein